MARKPGKRVVINRAAINAIRLGAADGLQLVGERILADARPHVPDAPPYGEGLVDTGKVVVYVDGKKVSGTGTAPAAVKGRQGTVAVISYDFPGRFLHNGTVYITPRPWIPQAIHQEAPQAGGTMVASMQSRLSRVR